MKTKTQNSIGKRAYEEALRMFETTKDTKNSLGLTSYKLLYDWMGGVSPSAKYLQRFHNCGADVIYILTGVRSK